MLQIFDQDRSEKRNPTLKVLQALVVFGTNIEEYMHLAIPAQVETITMLELQYISPKLLVARDLELAVPGRSSRLILHK